MAWALVDDGWWCHPKVMLLPLAARGLWISSLSWSCHQRRPLVPEAFLRMVGATVDDAAHLVESGLWIATADGYEIHDWAEYQQRSTSEKRAEAGRKGGKASGESRRGEANAKQTDVASEANGEAGPSSPVPSTPVPSKPSSSGAGPVDDEDEVYDEIATRRVQREQTAGRIRTSAQGVWNTTRANLPAEVGERVRNLLDLFDEPAATLADVVENGRSTSYLKRREPVA